MAQSSASVFGVLVLIFIVILPALIYGLYIIFKKEESFDEMISRTKETVKQMRAQQQEINNTVLMTESTKGKENDYNLTKNGSRGSNLQESNYSLRNEIINSHKNFGGLGSNTRNTLCTC